MPLSDRDVRSIWSILPDVLTEHMLFASLLEASIYFPRGKYIVDADLFMAQIR